MGKILDFEYEKWTKVFKAPDGIETKGCYGCISALKDCKNKQESYGEICVHCNKCGRFDTEDDEG